MLCRSVYHEIFNVILKKIDWSKVEILKHTLRGGGGGGIVVKYYLLVAHREFVIGKDLYRVSGM